MKAADEGRRPGPDAPVAVIIGDDEVAARDAVTVRDMHGETGQTHQQLRDSSSPNSLTRLGR